MSHSNISLSSVPFFFCTQTSFWSACNVKNLFGKRREELQIIKEIVELHQTQESLAFHAKSKD